MTWRNYFRLLAEDKLYSSPWTWLWKPLLKIASWFYGFGFRLHQGSYSIGIFKRRAFDRPVISVGNVAWGGTGKTPLVEYVSRFYLGRRKVPLILARGYGSDESKELAQKLPDAQFGFGKNRLEAGRKTLAAHPADVIILDDGFQHWPIKRDLEVVVINTLNPFGNGSLVPRGILREPLTCLQRASLLILNDVNLVARQEVEALKSKIRQIAPQIDFVEAYHEPLYFYRPHSGERIYFDRMEGRRVTTFSGIGTPRSFQITLNRLDIKVIRNFEFSDHHFFTEQELKEIRETKELSESEEVVTTEKDYFRCEDKIKIILRPLILKVRLVVSSREALLHEHLERLIAGGLEMERRDAVSMPSAGAEKHAPSSGE
ncbi:MAG: tetraacyldisaccharide 4'-kinase [Omnitrophica bacterium RIFCSPLOWO2_12_FULL_50_11]|nr:MAG: tetraacyldisaccharide 4'-kinase [Omnitrophica bacterium RIFCSPLOWO2_12_FULL_50_11]